MNIFITAEEFAFVVSLLGGVFYTVHKLGALDEEIKHNKEYMRLNIAIAEGETALKIQFVQKESALNIAQIQNEAAIKIENAK